MYKIWTVNDFEIGDTNSFTKTVTETDVVLFAGITGDFAPHHMDAEYAKTNRFGERIAHGILTCGLVSSALARMLAPGSVTKSHEFKFLGPVRFGDTITATVEVTAKDVERRRLTLRTYCTNQRGEMVLDGSTVQVMVGQN